MRVLRARSRWFARACGCPQSVTSSCAALVAVQDEQCGEDVRGAGGGRQGGDVCREGWPGADAEGYVMTGRIGSSERSCAAGVAGRGGRLTQGSFQYRVIRLQPAPPRMVIRYARRRSFCSSGSSVRRLSADATAARLTEPRELTPLRAPPLSRGARCGVAIGRGMATAGSDPGPEPSGRSPRSCGSIG
jgi:hypothetical protein